MAHRLEEASSYIRDLIRKSEVIRNGPPALYRLITTQSNLDTDGKVRKWTFGQRDITKPNKILLMVGETRTGKTTLINCLVNYTLGVKFKDAVWFEITEERTSDESITQTNSITVYEIFVPYSKDSLMIIDTPGYGHTKGAEYDRQIVENLHKLFINDTGVKDVDAVCLVIKASHNQLSARQHYIFDAVLSLFGKDIEENIVVLATHSDGGHPTNAIGAIKNADIPCKKDEQNNPVVYTFNNRQSESWNNKKQFYQNVWANNSFETFFDSLGSLNRNSLKETERVLRECTQLKIILGNLHDLTEYTELKYKKLHQIKEELEIIKDHIKKDENFTFTVTKSYKVKVPIEGTSLWDKEATCCSVCEENCHEHNCWFAPSASWCYVIQNEHCIVCTQKCHHSKHVKENKKYVTNIESVTMTYKDLKNQYESKENSRGNIRFDTEAFKQLKSNHKKNIKEMEENESLQNEVKADITKTNEDKARLVEEACTSIIILSEIALKPDSAFIIESLDYLIPLAEETKKFGKTEKLKELRKIQPESQERVQAALTYFRIGFKK
ncbi:uncharacterized protein LOC143475132 [Brachyhypopomus gauderio]|uniref:uncharacterized protein LOC143475132 n=1 Tax=Brachyhypopomus gauderio TaxID=698409 RepID=UPI004042399F